MLIKLTLEVCPAKTIQLPFVWPSFVLIVRPIRPPTILLCPSNDPAPRCAHVPPPPPPPSIHHPRRRMSHNAAAETAWYDLTVLSGSSRDCIFRIIHRKNGVRVGTNGRNTRLSNKPLHPLITTTKNGTRRRTMDRLSYLLSFSLERPSLLGNPMDVTVTILPLPFLLSHRYPYRYVSLALLYIFCLSLLSVVLL